MLPGVPLQPVHPSLGLGWGVVSGEWPSPATEIHVRRGRPVAGWPVPGRTFLCPGPAHSGKGISFLAIETRTPYRADFEAGDIGKTFYFALRWLSTRGQPGPWSQVYNAVIPG